MKFENIVQGSFGGAFMGIIATHFPSILGFDYRPTQQVELVASLVGLVLAAGICINEHRRETASGKNVQCPAKSK